jgi:hypothetical protein
MAKNTAVTRKVRVTQGKGKKRVTTTTSTTIDSGISVERSLKILEKNLDHEYGPGSWEYIKTYH